jgi:ribosomal-protein-alanine N-acetyltransferase
VQGLVIEPASKGDIDAIDEIEQHSFKSPWSKSTFEGELLREWARIDVARTGTRLVGFCNYWLVTTELHILAIATHPDFRGQGVARAVLDHVLDVAKKAGCSLATLEVRRSNRPAIALYERAGFKTVHVREDALVMLLGLTE